MEEKEKRINQAFHAIFMTDAVVCLFREVISFTGKDVKMAKNEDGVFLLFGQNAVKITPLMLRELEKHRSICLYELPEGEYAPDSPTILFELEPDAFHKLKELMASKKKN